MTNPIADRRKRAREAYYDYPERRGEHVGHPLDAAIEVATQVKITDDIWKSVGLPELAARAVCEAAFRAAGFEVAE